MTGSDLRWRREHLGLSQARLADELGVSPNTIARWEREELAIGNHKMLNLALNSLQTVGFRQALSAATERLGRLNVASPDLRLERRIQLAASQLRAWIERVSLLSDPDLERAVTAKSSFPGYRVLRSMQASARLNLSTRAQMSWATITVFRAMEIAERIWPFSWIEVTTTSSARRRLTTS
jgi:transcriptional regulator with XRE-family HTH domain